MKVKKKKRHAVDAAPASTTAQPMAPSPPSAPKQKVVLLHGGKCACCLNREGEHSFSDQPKPDNVLLRVMYCDPCARLYAPAIIK